MPPQTIEKQFEFTGSAGSFFVTYLVTILASLVPIIGWAWAFNYQTNWFVSNTKINGKKVSYRAGAWRNHHSAISGIYSYVNNVWYIHILVGA